MATAYVLYNLKAGNKTSVEDINILEIVLHDDVKLIDISRIKDYRIFLSGLEPQDTIILCGGDGTLNHFINDTDGIEYDNEVFCYPIGTGNDFANDLGYTRECNPFEITEYIKNLPTVTANEKTYRFLNGVGYGIDGYCCEVGDELKKIPDKKVNYTSIAIKGLLFHYKPTNAKVTVDGKIHTYEKVWIAPTMNGRYYGGGMMPTPNQSRNSGKLSTMIFHGAGKFRTLMIFPSIFKGKHIRHAKYVDILCGNEIAVEFDRPVALQIDGETILGVSSYTTIAPNSAVIKEKVAAIVAV